MPSETGLPRRTVLTALGAASLAGTFAAAPAQAAGRSGTSADATASDLPAAAAHWTFDEGSGSSAADSSGNAHTVALQGAAAWGTGKIGAHSLSLTAGGNASATGPALDTSEAFSVAAWVNLSQLGGYQTAVSIDGQVVSAFYLGLRDDTGTFAFARLASDATQGAAVAAATSAPTTGTWTHLVGVSDPPAGVTRLYVNGVLEGESDYTAGWAGTGDTAIGRALYGGGHVDQWHGLIDDVWMFPTALTSDQVATLAGVPVESTTPLLSVDVANPAHAVSPILPGLMFEDINHSGEGGIYAELVQNRTMMASDTSAVHWSAVGGTTLALDTTTPSTTPSTAPSRSHCRAVPGPATGPEWPTTDSGVSPCAPEPPIPRGCSSRRHTGSALSAWPSSRRTARRCTPPHDCTTSAPTSRTVPSNSPCAPVRALRWSATQG